MTPVFSDPLAFLAPPETQRQAACMAQDAFARLFRLSVEGDETLIVSAVTEMASLCHNWARAAVSDEARALRLALLVSGMDQWGLAYTQAFGLAAISGLSQLLGTLRNSLDATEDARFQQQFAAIEAAEGAAIDFKMELRRNIHLALWHAMIACEEHDESATILAVLGSMMLALTQQMPDLGWRLVADALAHVQIRCLTDAAAAGAQASTEALFNALRQSLTPEVADHIFAHANQAAIAWQQARRQAS